MALDPSQLTAAELKLYQQLQDELKKLNTQLNIKSEQGVAAFRALVKGSTEWSKKLTEIDEDLSNLGDSFGLLKSNFSAVVGNVKDLFRGVDRGNQGVSKFNSIVTRINTGLRQSTQLAEDYNANLLKSANVSKQIRKTEAEILELQQLQNSEQGRELGLQGAQGRALISDLQEQLQLQKKALVELKNQSKEIERNLGLYSKVPGMLKGLGNLSDIIDVENFENALVSAAKNGTVKLKTVGQELKKSIDDANLKEVLDSAVTDSKFADISNTLKDLDKVVGTIKQGTSTLNSLQDKYRDGALETKEVNIEINKIELERLRLKRLQNTETGKALGLDGKRGKELDKALAAEQERLEQIKQQNKKLDATVGMFGSIAGALKKLPVLSQVVNVEGFEKDLRKAAANGQSVMGAAFKSMAGGFGKLLSGLVTMMVGTVVDRAKVLDTSTGNLAKNLGVSYTEATNVTERFKKMAEVSGDIYKTAEEYEKVLSSIAETTDVSAGLDKKRLEFATTLATRGKFTAETVAEVAKLTAFTGENAEKAVTEATKQVALVKLQTGVNLNTRKILESINKLSASIKLNYGGSFAELAKAEAKVRAMGMSMNDLNGTANSLLNFESSIQAQMEAELMTGKTLNVDKARYLFLTGKTAEAAEVMRKDLGSAAEFGKMDLLTRESLANSYGKSADEVAKILLDSETQEKLSKEAAKTRFSNLETLQKEYKEQIKLGKGEEFLNKIASDELKTHLEQNTVQERTEALDKKRASALDGVALSLNKSADSMLKMVEGVKDLVKYLQIAAGVVTTLYATYKLMQFGKMFSGGPGDGGGGDFGDFGTDGGSRGKRRSKGTQRRKGTKGKTGKVKPKMRVRGRGLGGIALGLGSMLAGSYLTNTLTSSDEEEIGDEEIGAPAAPPPGGSSMTSDLLATSAVAAAPMGQQALSSKLSTPKTPATPKGKVPTPKTPVTPKGKVTAPKTPAAGSKGLFGKVGSFFSNAVSSIKESGTEQLAKVAKVLKAGAGKVLKFLFKIPVISTLLEGYFANQDIKEMILQGAPKDQLAQAVGSRVVGGVGSVLGGVGATALVNMLNLVGVPGFLASTVAYTLGSMAGNWAFSNIADAVGAKGLGNFVLDKFYAGEIKTAYKAPAKGATPAAESKKLGDDIVSQGYGKRTLLAPEGAIRLNDKDTVVAGTNLGGASGTKPQENTQVQKDMLRAMQEQNRLLMAILNKDTNVHLDGQKVSLSVAKNAMTTPGHPLNPASRTY